MNTSLGALVVGAALAFAGSAAAQESGYAFKVDNASGGAAAILVDGKSVCELSSGGHCTVTVSAEDHAYAFSLAGAAPKTFSPGNPEMVETCKIDAGDIRCIDTLGKPTN